jgi:nucleoside-diphosphate-sugar epimerase
MLIRPAAKQLLHSSLASDARILILGATGWFGRTALLMLDGFPDSSILPIASAQRQVDCGGRRFEIEEWSEQRVRAFKPTIILNFAFLTREKWELLGDAQYRQANRLLTERLLWAVQLPSVRLALTVSSGAALGDAADGNAYGEMKRAEEHQFEALAGGGRSLVIARAWSVSGPLVQRPRDYLFSDLILQARTGTIRITSECEVWRRYTSVDDYLAVCIARGLSGWSGTVDSGGVPVEAAALAQIVSQCVGGGTVLRSSIDSLAPPNTYMSDNQSWAKATESLGFEPAGLVEQVELTALGLSAS